MGRRRDSQEPLDELEPIEPAPFEEDQPAAERPAEAPQSVHYSGTHEDREGEAAIASAGQQRREGEALITDG
jgi:hypothetical protein